MGYRVLAKHYDSGVVIRVKVVRTKEEMLREVMLGFRDNPDNIVEIIRVG